MNYLQKYTIICGKVRLCTKKIQKISLKLSNNLNIKGLDYNIETNANDKDKITFNELKKHNHKSITIFNLSKLFVFL